MGDRERALFETARERIIRAFEEANAGQGIQYSQESKPYTSLRPLVGTIVEPFPNPDPTMAHLKFTKGQVLTFFNYGIGDSIPDGLGRQYLATDAETNQEQANNTNGAEEFAIEGFSLTTRSSRIAYPAALFESGGILADFTDADVVTAYGGQTPAGASGDVVVMYDPGSLATPPQKDSPINLENVFQNGVLPLCSLNIQFDRKDTSYIGAADEFPEGGAKSLLKASGDPNVRNRYFLPEGLWWHRRSEKRSSMQVILTLQHTVIVPVNLVYLLGQTSQDEDAAPQLPSTIAVDIKIRAHGMSFSPSAVS